MWSTRQMLHYQKVVLKTAPQWFLSLFHFPQDFLAAVLSTYIFYDLFLPYLLQKGETNKPPHAQKNKWERWTETDTLITWTQGFQKLLPSKFSSSDIPLWISSWDNIALWIIFMLFLHQWKWYLYSKASL